MSLQNKVLSALKMFQNYGYKRYTLNGCRHNSNVSSGPVKVVDQDGVRKITLCNPKMRNPLSLEVLKELKGNIIAEKDNPALRCIVLSAEGPVFSAGHNLKELRKSNGEDYHRLVFGTCLELMKSIIESPVPVIAAVNGLAAAAGCQLVAQCDIVVCTENSSFSTPGANFGIFCSTPGIAVARSVNRKVASHMLFTGYPVSASEALQAGLVSKVVPASQLDDEVKKITDAIKGKSRSVIELGKRFFYQQIERDIMTAYRLGSDVMVDNLALCDAQEGINSFIEKRKPSWSHNFSKA